MFHFMSIFRIIENTYVMIYYIIYKVLVKSVEEDWEKTMVLDPCYIHHT